MYILKVKRKECFYGYARFPPLYSKFKEWFEKNYWQTTLIITTTNRGLYVGVFVSANNYK